MSKFWLEDPCVLFKDPSIFPNDKMTKEEKLNALTRLAIIIAIVMWSMNYDNWLYFLLIALLIIIFLQYGPNTSKENFSIVPTYNSTDFQQTIVTPTFAEEWQNPPPAYDIYTNIPGPSPVFEAPLKPQSYPYGQYLTKTNLLPSDEYYTHLLGGTTNSAREYVNSTFLRNDLAFRDNMMRIYRKKLNRRFRHNCNDTFSPFHSY